MIELDKNFRDYVLGLPRADSKESAKSMCDASEYFLMSRRGDGYRAGTNGIEIYCLDKLYVPQHGVFLEFGTENPNVGAEPQLGKFYLEGILCEDVSSKLPKHLVDIIKRAASNIVKTAELNEDKFDDVLAYQDTVCKLAYLKRFAIMEHKGIGYKFAESWLVDQLKNNN